MYESPQYNYSVILLLLFSLFQNRCYPTWVKTRQESLQLADVIDTWWQDVYAFHLVDGTPQEMTSEVTVASGVGVFAQMARVVLKAAGRL